MQLRPEPSYFDSKVRQPGLALLEQQPSDLSKRLWSVAHSDLYRSYGGICAYTCHRIMKGVVDHFFPKSKYPELTYEWHNYRLSCNEANQHKGNQVGLMDPFEIGCEWFAIAFPQCDVVLGRKCPKKREKEAEFTIDALKLNNEFQVASRSRIAVEFRDGEVTLDFLRNSYPFVAAEIERQGRASGASNEAGFRKFIAELFLDLGRLHTQTIH